jgi:hypothetical protein
MRSSILACSLVLASFAPLACGGGTPQPKDENDVAGNEGSGGKGDKSADKAAAASQDTGSSSDSSSASSSSSSSAADSSKGGGSPASSSTASSSTPPTTSGSGDLKPAGDDPWLAGHQMAPKDVMKTMHASEGKVKACFKAGLKRDPSTNGEVKIRFVITNDGAVRAWKDNASSMTDEEVTNCVGDLIKTLKFPKQKSPGDAWGTYNISF